MREPQAASVPRLAPEARTISHSYPGHQAFKALTNVSIALREGETLAVVGVSGSGKSTLWRILLGLSPLSEGRVLCFGKDIGSLSRRERAARMQPVFQDPYSSLNPRHTLAGIVAAPLLAPAKPAPPP
ncbi:ATP-binding cassette domain-containing protein [Sinorhizobium medicae]|nr:ATP-binding cassette domain-containing protein [Sinorhizobium medicae]